MNELQINKLDVWRKLASGAAVKVGELAQNKQGIYFQYHTDYLNQYQNLSPFNLKFDSSVQLAPKNPHNNLHGAFSDSLPDGWGLLLMDRIFRQSDILPAQITAMDRLAFVGKRAMGALFYQPVSALQQSDKTDQISIAEIGLQAQAIFDGQTTDILQVLVDAGSSGGARPKAQLYLKETETKMCSTSPSKECNPYLVKFTSSQLALKHEEGICEAAYLTMAHKAGIEVPKWILLDAPKNSGAKKWLALKRFDIIKNAGGLEGRLHLHSASGLLDADYRMPSLDYEDLIKATSMLCKSPAAGQTIFRRMVFNLFTLNQDDHSKNWAFLQQDNGEWQLAPFYDVTFSPSPYNEHATAFAGFGKKPSLKAMQKLANQANFSSWKQAQQVIEDVLEAINHFTEIATELEIEQTIRKLIKQKLNNVYLENKLLVQR